MALPFLKKTGNVRSFWNGVEYFTDGLVYFWFVKDGEHVGMFALPSEKDAKKLIDGESRR